MTINLDGYTVEIMAKRPNRIAYNTKDTIDFLAHLACLAWDASSWNSTNGWNAISECNAEEAMAYGDAWKALEGEGA